MTRYKRRSSLQNNIKDYLVPIVGWVIILLLILKLLSWDTVSPEAVDQDTWDTNSNLDISFSWTDTKAFISYPGDKQEEITDSIDLYPGETVTVWEGVISLSSQQWTKISLNKIAELKYNNSWNYSFLSSDAWFELGEDTAVAMRYANIEATKGSIFSITQNEAGSSIYMLSWSAKVSNLEWVSTILSSGQKISISRLNASNKDLDIVNEKWDIDSYFKSSDWFLENNWPVILAQVQKDTEENSDSENNDEEIWGQEGIFISFDSLRDEMNTDKKALDVSWSVNSEDVWAITINNIQAPISQWAQTFILTGIPLTKWVNDIVVKVFTTSQDILEKKVFTVYSSNGETLPQTSNSQTTQTVSSVNSQWVTTYSVDATDFWFTAPSVTGKFSTEFWEVTIRWITTAEWIAKVEVNGFELGSFNGSTWRYHAFERFETLEEWSNQYKVDYFWESGNIVYTDYYTIVKQSSSSVVSTSEVVEEEVISDEASVTQ